MATATALKGSNAHTDLPTVAALQIRRYPMGSWYSRLSPFQQKYHSVMVGFNSSGKTTILNKLACGNIGTLVTATPTLWVHDFHGDRSLRALHRYYYQKANTVIMVVDSNDHDSLDQARTELNRVMDEDELLYAHLLVIANN